MSEFRYTAFQNAQGQTLMRPYLPLTLGYNNKALSVSGLLDTGADVNVLPYEIGLQLGAVWEDHPNRFTLSGNMAGYEARGIILSGIVDDFPSLRLAFAWVQAPNVPLILGRVNFFTEFSICFFASENRFQIQPK